MNSDEVQIPKKKNIENLESAAEEAVEWKRSKENLEAAN